MSTVRVPDDGGDEMIVYKYDDFNFPPQAIEFIQLLPSVKLRSDDILIAAYPKSGTHWVWEIIRLLVAGEMDKKPIGKISQMMDFLPEKMYKDLPSPRILNTHLLFRHLPEEIKTKRPKIIHITRNPKDVAVSYYHFAKSIPEHDYKGKWENFYRPYHEGKFACGSWFDYIKDWEHQKQALPDLPIMTSNYEDLKEDCVREARKLCSFLNLDRSDDFIRQVCEQCEFSSMKSIKKSDTGHVTYRKGQVGDWKNWFTVAQNEWFDQLYQEKMKDCQLKFRFTID